MVLMFIFLFTAALLPDDKKLSLAAFYLSFATGIFWFVYHASSSLELLF